MALTRKLLSALGIDADKQEQIIEAHTETVDAIKRERDDFKAKSESYDKVKAQLDEMKEAAKSSGDYDKLKKEFDDYKAEVAKKETLAVKKAAFAKVAKDAGLTEAGIAKAVKYADFDALEVDDSGKVKDAKTLIKSLREEWPEHIAKASTEGANTATPPASNPAGAKSRDEIMKIKDPVERQAAWGEFLKAQR